MSRTTRINTHSHTWAPSQVNTFVLSEVIFLQNRYNKIVSLLVRVQEIAFGISQILTKSKDCARKLYKQTCGTRN